MLFCILYQKFNASDNAPLFLSLVYFAMSAAAIVGSGSAIIHAMKPVSISQIAHCIKKTSVCGLRKQNLLFDEAGNLVGEQRAPPALLGHLLSYRIPWATHQFPFGNCAKFNLIRRLLRREAIKMQRLSFVVVSQGCIMNFQFRSLSVGGGGAVRSNCFFIVSLIVL